MDAIHPRALGLGCKLSFWNPNFILPEKPILLIMANKMLDTYNPTRIYLDRRWIEETHWEGEGGRFLFEYEA